MEARTDQAVRNLAILPFLQLDDPDEFGPLSLGMADTLVTTLANVKGLVVRPLSAVLRYIDRDRDVIEIGAQLQVDVVLEGSLQAGDHGFRISARLLRVADGECLWAGQFTTNARDLFAMEDEMAGPVADAVAVEITGSKPVIPRSRQTDDPEVHIACIKGQYCWHKWTVNAWMQSIRHFERALKLQPDHAPSLAGLAAAWSTLGIFGVVAPVEAFARAREAATQAVAIDADYSKGHEIMGAIHLFHDWDLGAAADCLDRAIEIDPDSCNARHLRALILAVGGSDLPAQTEIQRALRCDPQSLITRTDVGYIHYWGRRYRQAEKIWRSVLETDPHFPHARQALAGVLVELGDLDRALGELRRALNDAGRDPEYSGDLAWLLGRMAQKGQAREILNHLTELGRRDYVDPYQIALAHLGLEEYDAMLATLDRALANRSRDIVLIPINPMFDPVRSDPRLQAFLKTALPKIVIDPLKRPARPRSLS